jgi:hypothetical protein
MEVKGGYWICSLKNAMKKHRFFKIVLEGKIGGDKTFQDNKIYQAFPFP